MSKLKDKLTNERFKGLFKNNFDLANYAIKLGQYRIRSGHELHLEDLFDEIEKHPNPSYLRDLQEADALESETRKDHGTE